MTYDIIITKRVPSAECTYKLVGGCILFTVSAYLFWALRYISQAVLW
jgi:hypothetical protein